MTRDPLPCPDCQGTGQRHYHHAFGGLVKSGDTCHRCDGRGTISPRGMDIDAVYRRDIDGGAERVNKPRPGGKVKW
jgi:hypothetical protein